MTLMLTQSATLVKQLICKIHEYTNNLKHIKYLDKKFPKNYFTCRKYLTLH